MNYWFYTQQEAKLKCNMYNFICKTNPFHPEIFYQSQEYLTTIISKENMIITDQSFHTVRVIINYRL